MSTPAHGPATGLDLAALDAITDAVESGAGLPEVVRAAARALDASLVLTDRAGAVLAVAARSPADERSLLDDAPGVEALELRVADAPVGTLRMRARSETGPALVKLVTTLIASEVERLRAPERASEQRAGRIRARAARPRHLRPRGHPRPRRRARDRPRRGREHRRRARTLARADRGRLAPAGARRGRSRRARPCCPGRRPCWPRAPTRWGPRSWSCSPGADDASAARAAEAILRELQSALPGHTFALGRSRPAPDPVDLHRAGAEALLAANVAEGDADRPVLAFEESGAYRLLLSAMSEDPAELQRFYAETVEPLVAYDEQYETGLVQTVEAFLEADGNVAGTAQRLFTHRHTIRYRLERVKELSGLDVGSTDGREKLSLGLKAMRVLGIANRGGPASEAGASGGRVPRRT